MSKPYKAGYAMAGRKMIFIAVAALIIAATAFVMAGLFTDFSFSSGKCASAGYDKASPVMSGLTDADAKRQKG